MPGTDYADDLDSEETSSEELDSEEDSDEDASAEFERKLNDPEYTLIQ